MKSLLIDTQLILIDTQLILIDTQLILIYTQLILIDTQLILIDTQLIFKFPIKHYIRQIKKKTKKKKTCHRLKYSEATLHNK